MSVQNLQAWATLAITLLIAVLGVWIQRTIAEDSARRGYIDIAVRILTQAPSGQDKGLRQWAAQVLAKNSPVPIPADLIDRLSTGEAGLAMPNPPDGLSLTVK